MQASRPASACWRCVIKQLPKPSNGSISSTRLFSNSTHKQPSRTRQLAPPRNLRTARRISTTPSQNQQVELARESQSYARQSASATSSTLQDSSDQSRLLLQPNNLFHSFSDSPSPIIRRRAAFIKQNAYCAHPEHQQTRQPASPHDLEARKDGAQPPAHVRYECPDCGIPVSCSEEHFVDDYETHLEICDTLREINEDDHDLVSGRFFPEFEYPGPQIDEAQVNMMNWDTFLYSREFNAINDERSLRQATRLMTYPATIASVLHELSPYDMRGEGRLTAEGLKSFSGVFCPRPFFSLSFLFTIISILTFHSTPLHTSPREIGRWTRHQGPASQPSTSPSLHPGCPRRIISPS